MGSIVNPLVTYFVVQRDLSTAVHLRESSLFMLICFYHPFSLDKIVAGHKIICSLS